ncbi:MAG: hypothetical protein EAZ15_00495 [Sphingobacteriales bacterium]|nr:MAG: hypothetical protein EAZ15_00495 [Sphingobacteriales bacterium]
MITTFEVKPNELDDSFLALLQSIMKGRSSKIIVEPLVLEEDDETEMDETEFLLGNPANKAMLLNALEQVENGNVIEVSWDEHNKMYEDLKLRVANGE